MSIRQISIGQSDKQFITVEKDPILELDDTSKIIEFTIIFFKMRKPWAQK